MERFHKILWPSLNIWTLNEWKRNSIIETILKAQLIHKSSFDFYWHNFYLIFSGNQNRQETMTSFHFDQSLNRLFSEFIHIFSTYFCKHFFCVFFHFISNIYCQLLLFHMLVNIMKNMNVIKKNYFYKYANLFWVK